MDLTLLGLAFSQSQCVHSLPPHSGQACFGS